MSQVGKKHFRVIEKKLHQLGYQLDYVNGRGGWIYTHGTLPQIQINPSMNERSAATLGKKLDKELGLVRETNKRNAQAIKSRRADERERAKVELEALDKRRQQILAEKDALPTGDLADLGRDQRLALEREMESIERERLRWQRLMTELPAPIDKSARHRA